MEADVEPEGGACVHRQIELGDPEGVHDEPRQDRCARLAGGWWRTAVRAFAEIVADMKRAQRAGGTAGELGERTGTLTTTHSSCWVGEPGLT